MGHFTRDCRAPRQDAQWRVERQQAQTWGRTTKGEEEEKETPDQAPRDKADSWLHAVAGEEDDIKNMILRDLMGEKDFLNA
jgi:hypothetical protein